MHYAATLPDEFHAGYFGRLVEINGLPKDRIKSLKVLKAIVLADGFPYDQAPYMTQLLAFAANMTVPQFVRNHTLVPYRRAIASHKPNIAHGDPSDLEMLRYGTTRTARREAYFCAECCAADVIDGMSYWRCTHQIPGMYICTIHGTALRYMEAQSAFQLSPSECMASSHIIDHEWATQSHADPLVTNFVELAKLFSASDRPLEVRVIRKVLVRRAREEGISIYARSTKELLSDRIVARFPSQWLETLFPGITTKQHGDVLHQIDGVLYLNTCSSSVAAYILAICVLFESIEDALETLRASSDNGPFERSTNANARHVSVEALRAEYVEARGCHTSIALKYQLPKSSMIARLNRLGLPNLSLSKRGLGPLLEAVSGFYVKGLSMARSAEQAGVSLVDLERIVRYAGVGYCDLLKQMSVPSKSTAALGKNLLPHRMGLASRCDGS